MIHRALLGSLERFIGVFIEHCAVNFPLWLSPVQVWVIPIGTRHKRYAEKIGKELKEKDMRIKIKDDSETVSKKIREGEIQKIPYMLVVGDKEIKKSSVRARQRKKGDIGEMTINKFIEKVILEVKEKEEKLL